MIELSCLEIFFICTTLISLVLNIIQSLKINPVYNSLCGLMNDCRTKAKYYKENTKNEDISNKIITDLDGFGQHIYGILKNIKQKDKLFCAYSLASETEYIKKP